MQIMSECNHELREAQGTIHTALKNSPVALQSWLTFETGYMYVISVLLDLFVCLNLKFSVWHLTQDRYLLKDIFPEWSK